MNHTDYPLLKAVSAAVIMGATLVPARAQVSTNAITISASYAVPAGSVDTNKPGFTARVHQIPVARGPGDRNSTANAEKQLANGFIDPATGAPYPNEADLSQAVNGLFTVAGIINWNQDAPLAIGNFSDASTPPFVDEPIPGIPGINGSIDNIAAEILTFLELRAGTYRMGVNSDDGFKVTVGPNPRDLLSLVLGSFNTGRGSADSLFDIVVTADGIYPFRLVWWEGDGGANLEWFTVNAVGQKIPINDRSNTEAIKAYREGPAGPIFIKAASPAPGSGTAPVNTTINVTLGDGAEQVLPSTVKLLINGLAVNATANKPTGSSETQIAYDPPVDFAFEEVVRVGVVYGASAANVVTNEYTFSISPRLLVAIDDQTKWRYENTGVDLGTAWKERNFNDSAWPEGAALLAFEPGATAEPLRTELVRQKADGTGNIVTDYFRTRFIFNGNPGLVSLRLRHVVDDGVVFYLNGAEIHRFGLPAGLSVSNGTFFGGHENAYAGPFDVSAAGLVTGTNVLAAEVHQSDLTSSDIVFGAELQVLVSTNAPTTSIASLVPAAGAANVLPDANLQITLLEGTRQVLTNSIQLTVNGQPVVPTLTQPPGSVATVITYDPPVDFVRDTVVTVGLTFRDSATPGNVTTTNYTFSIEPVFALLFAIDDNQKWRYENNGQDLGTAWKEKAFNDSAWLEGAALLALEGGNAAEPIRTTLSRQSPEGNQIITDYFRTHFSFTGDPAAARMRIRHVVDDGVVVYLNGVEIHRFGIAAGLTFTNGTLFNGHENRYEGPFDISTASLVQGDNVIAAEVHQSDAGSSDIVFGLELQVVTSTRPVELQFTSVTRSGSNIMLQWIGGGTLESADAIPGTWAPVANAASPYSAPVTGTARFYRLRR